MRACASLHLKRHRQKKCSIPAVLLSGVKVFCCLKCLNRLLEYSPALPSRPPPPNPAPSPHGLPPPPPPVRFFVVGWSVRGGGRGGGGAEERRIDLRTWLDTAVGSPDTDRRVVISLLAAVSSKLAPSLSLHTPNSSQRSLPWRGGRGARGAVRVGGFAPSGIGVQGDPLVFVALCSTLGF